MIRHNLPFELLVDGGRGKGLWELERVGGLYLGVYLFVCFAVLDSVGELLEFPNLKVLWFVSSLCCDFSVVSSPESLSINKSIFSGMDPYLYYIMEPKLLNISNSFMVGN